MLLVPVNVPIFYLCAVPILREYVCIPVAQMFHWYEIKLKMMTMDLGVGGKKITKVPKLNEAKAIEQVKHILIK